MLISQPVVLNLKFVIINDKNPWNVQMTWAQPWNTLASQLEVSQQHNPVEFNFKSFNFPIVSAINSSKSSVHIFRETFLKEIFFLVPSTRSTTALDKRKDDKFTLVSSIVGLVSASRYRKYQWNEISHQFFPVSLLLLMLLLFWMRGQPQTFFYVFGILFSLSNRQWQIRNANRSGMKLRIVDNCDAIKWKVNRIKEISAWGIKEPRIIYGTVRRRVYCWFSLSKGKVKRIFSRNASIDVCKISFFKMKNLWENTRDLPLEDWTSSAAKPLKILWRPWKIKKRTSLKLKVSVMRTMSKQASASLRWHCHYRPHSSSLALPKPPSLNSNWIAFAILLCYWNFSRRATFFFLFSHWWQTISRI